jgi:hypothetical protein
MTHYRGDVYRDTRSGSALEWETYSGLPDLDARESYRPPRRLRKRQRHQATRERINGTLTLAVSV